MSQKIKKIEYKKECQKILVLATFVFSGSVECFLYESLYE